MVDADQKGRCRPEGSMPTGWVVDADQKGRCYAKFRQVRKKPERQTVGTPKKAGIPENTGT
jgi:hypothetical protein